jgi:hypothetical protein
VSGPDKLIADALRDMASHAATPRPMSGAAWRAGRRRRLRVIAAGAASAIAAAVLLPLAAAGALGHPGNIGHAVPAEAPMHLQSPIQFRQVATIGAAPCAAGSAGLPGRTAHDCYYLTGTGMTVTTVESAQITGPGPGQYAITFSLTPAGTGPLAALTRELAGLPGPRNQLAIIISGHVIAHPAVISPITRGKVHISGFATHSQAERFLQGLRAASHD